MNLPKAKRIQLAKLMKLVKEIPTEEGAILFVEGDVTVDTEVFVSDTDGNMIPAPDGTYTAEGKIITVTAGKISEIKDVETDPVDDNETPETMEDDNPDPTDTDNPDELKARIAELETEIAEKDNKIAELEAKIAEYEQNEETPAADSIEDEEKKNKFNKEEKPKGLTQRILDSILN